MGWLAVQEGGPLAYLESIGFGASDLRKRQILVPEKQVSIGIC